MNARIHNYHNGFVKNAFKSIAQLIEDQKDELNMKEAIAEDFASCLKADPVEPGADLFTYAYQWNEWSMDPKEQRWASKMAQLLLLSDFHLI